jgi:hypothetical protein
LQSCGSDFKLFINLTIMRASFAFALLILSFSGCLALYGVGSQWGNNDLTCAGNYNIMIS